MVFKYGIVLLFFLLASALRAETSKTEQCMVNQGLVDIHSLDKSIKVSLMYSRPDNFTGKILYTDLTKAYLHPKAAKALVNAQKILKRSHPQYSLIIFDATRPMSIQQVMWDEVKDTPKYFYVSNPAHGGGLHNYGLAVDISICNEKGDTITMGTKVDHMSKLSHINNEAQLLAQGKLSKAAVRNRQLLRKVMREAGFRPLSTEWWHFNLVSRATAKKYYKVVK